MAMDLATSGEKRVRPDMNVTPLVDVVLVLLIIFMVLAPVLTRSFFVRVPPKEDDRQQNAAIDPNVPVVLSVHEDGSLDVNDRPIEGPEAPDFLRRVLNARSDRILYVDGADDAPYGAVIEAVDVARRGGAAPIVLLTHELR